MILISNLVQTKQLTKKSNGGNIFNAMKSEVNKDPSIKVFDLDFKGISLCAPFVFKEIFALMQSKLEGNYQVVLHNANPMIKNSFQIAIG